jgi:hypothetical protein
VATTQYHAPSLNSSYIRREKEDRPMNRAVVPLRAITNEKMNRVVQALNPEAVSLLKDKGGDVRDYSLHGLSYWEYVPVEHQYVLSWPPHTQSVYVSPQGQEDRLVLFMAFLLPECTRELHLVYDYRFSPLYGTLEEYFTLEVAQKHEAILLHDQEHAGKT